MKIDFRTVGLFEENSYLVVDETTGRGVLVDPGDDGELLVEMIRASGATLDAIWITHAHIDHIGAISTVRRHYKVPVHLHPLDLPWYEHMAARSAEAYGIPWEQPDIAPLPLADGDVLTCGSVPFTVMHVPGHAPGHVSFNGPDLTLSGDLLFAGSIGRTDLPLSDPYAMDKSLERIATLPHATAVYPGHGPRTTIERELQSNPFLSGRARARKG
jgi:glyoxylase-like metal-dependent hydrolase (beta-lactamase superfamily II)